MKTLANHIWITANKRKIPVSSMTTDHIYNVINSWNGQGKIKIPEAYLGGKEKWFPIFERELIRRQ